MTGWLPDGAADWQGQPVAHRVADAVTRCRAVLSGTVRAVDVRAVEVRAVDVNCGHPTSRARRPRNPVDRAGVLDARLDDGSGVITLRWLGRTAIPGVVVGAALDVEGTVSSVSGRLVILNPLYRFTRFTVTAQVESSTSW